jgi:hypothetical protein
MDISGFTNNIGVVIVGGIVVITVAYFMFRPRRSNKTPEKNGVDGGLKENATNVPENTLSSTVEAVNDQPSSPMKETRRFLLGKMRSMKKPDILSSKSNEDNGQSTDNEEEQISSETVVPIEDNSVISSDIDEDNEENLNNTPDIEVSDEEKPEIPLSMSVEDIKPDFQEMEKTSVFESSDDNDSLEDDMDTELTDDDSEADNTQLEDAVEDKEQLSEKPKSGGGVFDLFTEAEEEENDISKFASGLDQVDINDLLQEARNIHKHIRR